MALIYTCAVCGESFESTWSDTDALTEYREKFSEEMRPEPGEPRLTCDVCFQTMMEECPPEEASKRCAKR